eukprot:IDg6677t1
MIAESVGNPTLFEPLQACGEKARKILLKAAASNFSTNARTNEYVDKLLGICGGLPLTLSIAGAGVKQELKRRSNTCSAIKHYCERLERFFGKKGDAPLPDYPCLSHVIEASLNHCEQWRQDATDIVEKFEEASLVRLEPCGEETGLRLHDLVLKLCRGMVQDDERRSWHRRLCESYSSRLPELQAWWNVEDDSYIMANLSRHLIEGGLVSVLQVLLFDVRWLWRRKHSGGWMAWEMDFE